ncbi:DNA-directed RNA polymerase [Candidatus Woesearchaeota archaeon]|nr:DNA-directed RNA polymerase [Candidatus Woesearchaeota archaeon]
MRRDDRNQRQGNFRNNNFRSGPREMHEATCADCGASCQVPFVPKEDRPVYCRDCFAKHRTF